MLTDSFSKLLALLICPVMSHLMTFRRICCCFIHISHVCSTKQAFELRAGAQDLGAQLFVLGRLGGRKRRGLRELALETFLEVVSLGSDRDLLQLKS